MNKATSIVYALAYAMMLVILPAEAYAQLDERAPGIYTVVDGESVAVPYLFGLQVQGGVGIGPASVTTTNVNYKGATSGINASDTFVLVVDPKKSVGAVTPKKFTCFTKNLTPEFMTIIPLTVELEENRRNYNSGVEIGALVVDFTAGDKPREYFEWERISDNSFQIKTFGLKPGEYGFVFRTSALAPGAVLYQSYAFFALFGFTVPEMTAAVNEVSTSETGEKAEENARETVPGNVEERNNEQ